MISAPIASNTGNLSTSFQIVVPPGRGGLTPQVALNYSSEGRSSWVGYGWSLQTPAITLDTRWGSPIYDDTYETEIYMLNGEQLMYPGEYMPNRHMTNEETGGYETEFKTRAEMKDGNPFVRFYERRLGSFDKIERIGGNPANYRWVVTKPNGTKYYYGGGTNNDKQVLETEDGNRFHWALRKVEDKYGNKIEYRYYKRENNLYPRWITYSYGNGGESYRITFASNVNDSRKDVVLNGTNGIIQRDQTVLSEIKVTGVGDELIRSYRFNYAEGKFSKNRLMKIREKIPGTADDFLVHDFSYFDDFDCSIFGETPDVTVNIPCEGEFEDDCGEVDSDGDGINDLCDDCPNFPNLGGIPCPFDCESWTQGDPNTVLVAGITLNPDLIGSAEDIVDISVILLNLGTEPLSALEVDLTYSLFSAPTTTYPIQITNIIGDVNGNGSIDPGEIWYYKAVKSFEYSQGDVFIIGAGASGLGACGMEIAAAGDLLFTSGVNMEVDILQDEVRPGDMVDVTLTSRLLIDEDAASNPGYASIAVGAKEVQVPLKASQWEGRNLRISSPLLNNGIEFDPFDKNINVRLSILCEQAGVDAGRNLANVLDESESIESKKYVNAKLDAKYQDARNEFPDWQFCFTTQIPENYTQPTFEISARDQFSVWRAMEKDAGSKVFKGFEQLPNFMSSGSDSDVVKIIDNNTVIAAAPITLKDKIGPGIDNNLPHVSGSSVSRNSSDPCTSDFISTFIGTLYGIPTFGDKFSPLSTTESKNGRIGFEAGIGLTLKDLNKQGGFVSIDLGGSLNISESEGKTVHVDINGDGHNDIVMLDDGQLFFKPHTVNVVESTVGLPLPEYEHSYGDFQPILGIDEISHSYNEGVSFNLSLSYGGVVGGQTGISDGGSSSENYVYIHDVNSDQLPDLAVNGVVYFNRIIDGTPTFTPESLGTENLIISGCTIEKTEPDNFKEDLFDFPNYEVVKVWEAPHEGNIIISNHKILNENSDYDVSIEIDNSVYISREAIAVEGTCRLYGGNSTLIPNSINDLSHLSENILPCDCQFTGLEDPCAVDSDGDGVNDCLDNCPGEDDECCLCHEPRLTCEDLTIESEQCNPTIIVDFVIEDCACCDFSNTVFNIEFDGVLIDETITFDCIGTDAFAQFDFQDYVPDLCTEWGTIHIISVIPSNDAGCGLEPSICRPAIVAASPETHQECCCPEANDCQAAYLGDGAESIETENGIFTPSVTYLPAESPTSINNSMWLTEIQEQVASESNCALLNTEIQCDADGEPYLVIENTDVTLISIFDDNSTNTFGDCSGISEENCPSCYDCLYQAEFYCPYPECNFDCNVTAVTAEGVGILPLNYDFKWDVDGAYEVRDWLIENGHYCPGEIIEGTADDCSGQFELSNVSLELTSITYTTCNNADPTDCQSVTLGFNCLSDNSAKLSNKRNPKYSEQYLDSLYQHYRDDLMVRYGVVKRNSKLESGRVTANNDCQDNNYYPDTTDPDTLSSLKVRKGQKIYFRLHATGDEDIDKLDWNPEIKYTSVLGQNISEEESEQIIDNNGARPFKESYEDAFLIEGSGIEILAPNGVATITWPEFTVSNNSDEIIFEIIANKYSIPEDADASTPDAFEEPSFYTLTITVPANSIDALVSDGGGIEIDNTCSSNDPSCQDAPMQIEFRIKTRSNVDFKNLDWKPKMDIVTTQIPTDGIYVGDPEIFTELKFPVPEISTYKHFVPEYHFDQQISFWKNHNDYTIGASASGLSYQLDPAPFLEEINIDEFKNLVDEDYPEDYEFYVVVKSGLEYLGHTILAPDGDTFEGDLLDFTVSGDEAQQINIEIYTAETDLSLAFMHYLEYNDDNALFELHSTTSTTGIPIDLISRKNLNIFTKVPGVFGPLYRMWGQVLYNASADSIPLVDCQTPFGNLLNTPKLQIWDTYDQTELETQLATLEALGDGSFVDIEGDNNHADNPQAGVDAFNSIVSDLSLLEDGLRNQLFVQMYPKREALVVIDPEVEEEVTSKDKWLGAVKTNYSTDCSYGIGNVQLSLQQEFGIGGEPGPKPLTISSTGAFSLSNFSKSSNTTFMLGYPDIFTDGNITLNANSRSLSGYFDLNGDRYPDMMLADGDEDIRTGFSQFSNPTGGLYPTMMDDNCPGPICGGYSEMGPISFSDNFNVGRGVTGRFKVLGENAMLSGNFGTGNSNTEEGWLDFNGDGLPDKYRLHEIENTDDKELKVIYNIGKGFNEAEDGSDISEQVYLNGDILDNPLSASLDYSIGYGLGYTFSQGNSFSGNYSKNKSTNDVMKSTLDFNGDGLVDYLYRDVYFDESIPLPQSTIYPPSFEYTKIAFNSGEGFEADACDVHLPFQSRTETRSQSFAGGFSFGFPTFNFLGITVKIVANITSGFTKSENTVTRSFEDYNKDGLVDLLVYNSDGELEIYYNRVGRTNLLEKIEVSSGLEYAFDYNPEVSTYDNPQSSWVVNKIKTTDLTSTDGATGENVRTKLYKYYNGKYDRRERSFYGYEIMQCIEPTSNDVEIQDVAGNIFRQKIDVYHNDSYYLKGRMRDQYVVNADEQPQLEGDVYTYTNSPGNTLSASHYTYELRDAETGSNTDHWTMSDMMLDMNYDVGGEFGLGRAFTILTNKQDVYYNESGTGISVSENFEYDEYGRITDYTKEGLVHSVIEYFPNSELPYDNLNIYNVPKSIEVNDLTGNAANSLLRKRINEEVDGNGDVTKIGVYTDGSNFNTTEISYADNGNIEKITYPSHEENADALFIEYTYDDTLQAWPKTIISSEGPETSITYDYRFGLPENTTDVAGNTITNVYDVMGRLISVTAPKEQGTGNPTISMTYQDEFETPGTRPWASTEHYDQDNPDNTIKTVSISNGFGQSVQVKKDVQVEDFERAFVSGIQIFDTHGRVIQEYNPTQTDNITNNFIGALSPYSSSTTYDIWDRPTASIDALNHSTTFDYSINNGNSETVVTVDQNGSQNVVQTTSKDAFGHLVEEKTNDLSTTFEYDGASQLLETMDNLDHSTFYTYDVAGRLLSRNHPDAGVTSYGYDPLDKIVSIINANGEEITFQYDVLGRMLTKTFPGTDNLNTVSYTYYEGGEGSNSYKLHTIQDGTGLTTYTYGNMGEVVSEIKQIVSPHTDQANYTFECTYAYDSWNRIQEMSYPDGETLFYNYDLGGNLKSVQNDETDPYQYIKNIEYDYYGQMTYIQYANDTESHYYYEPELRRLDGLNVKNGNGNDLYFNVYEYDFVWNVTDLDNNLNSSGSLGGEYYFDYEYDSFNRLLNGTGDWQGDETNDDSEFSTAMTYDGMQRILQKNQTHTFGPSIINNNPVDNAVAENSYIHDYHYDDDNNHLLKITEGGNDVITFNYDPNGNLTNQTYVNAETSNRNLLWDEENRLRAVSIGESHLQHNIYNSAGERTLSGDGNLELVTINGQVEDENMNVNPHTLYPSGYLTVAPSGQYTKHYYNGTSRIASRLQGTYDNTGDFPGAAAIKAKQQTELSGIVDELFDDYDLHYLSHPDLEYDCTNLTGQALAQCNCFNDNNCTDLVYFFHTDHLGSSTFMTDDNGVSYQFLLYLPFGETMVSQSNATFETPYQYTGQELDEETGLYYYGARYYDPGVSQFLSVDPMASKYPESTPYHYVFNNPINIIDPDGRDTLPALGINRDLVVQDNLKEQRIIDESIPIYDESRGGLYLTSPFKKGPQIGELEQGENVEVRDAPVGTIKFLGSILFNKETENAKGHFDDNVNHEMHPEIIGLSKGEFLYSGNLVLSLVSKDKDSVSHIIFNPLGDPIDTNSFYAIRPIGYYERSIHDVMLIEFSGIVKDPKRKVNQP